MIYQVKHAIIEYSVFYKRPARLAHLVKLPQTIFHHTPQDLKSKIG